MPKRLKVAVVGCGVGKAHIHSLRKLQDMFEVVAVCDTNAAKAHKVATDYGIAEVYTDIADVCRLNTIDVIDICTPPAQHYDHIEQVLAAGKHAICEKPLVGSLKQLDALALQEKQSGKRVMPILQYRFGHGIQKLKHLVDSGIAGRLYLSTVETAWRRRADYYRVAWRGKWATELGGTLLVHAIHALDMLCYVIGPAKSVYAYTATLVNPIEVEDCAAVSMQMADGSLASLSATVGSAVEITRHRFCFSNLTAESNTRPYDNYSDPWLFVGDSPGWSKRIAEALSQFVPRAEAFEGQFERFYSALKHGTELPVTLDDARVSLEIITAMYYSVRTGQPVDLPLLSDHPGYAGWAP